MRACLLQLQITPVNAAMSGEVIIRALPDTHRPSRAGNRLLLTFHSQAIIVISSARSRPASPPQDHLSSSLEI
jgi:hypothetical protein